MKVNIGFAQYVATIEFKAFLGEDVEAFEDWYFEELEDGTIRKRPNLNNEVFDAQVIIDWLLEASPECNAKIIEPFLKVGEEDESLPYMCF